MTPTDEPLALPPPDDVKRLPAPGAPAHDRDRRPVRRRPFVIGAVVLLLVLAVGWFFHHRQAAEAKEANERARNRLPSVAAIEVKPSPPVTDLLLPGNVTAVTEATLYARASGYLKARYVDIGDTVRRGQVLAEIDSPDLDQQVAQGRAAVAQARQQLGQSESTVNDARARLALAKSAYARYQQLIEEDAAAALDVEQRRQEFESAQATLASNIANVAAARENVRAETANAQRLQVLQDYEKLRAPFDGIVTARNIDVGALINGSGGTSSASGSTNPTNSSSGGTSASGTSGGSSSSSASSGGGASTMSTTQPTELFRVAQADRLRIFVTVPGDNATGVEVGTDASVFVSGFEQPFIGRVARTARAIDPTARTLLTEVELDNQRHQLLPGTYAQVRFHSLRGSAPLLIPGEAIIARAGGTSVAVLDDLSDDDRRKLPDSPDRDRAKRVHLQPVAIGRDYGTEAEITRGLDAGRTIVSNPGDDVVDGAIVVPKKPDGNGGDGHDGNDGGAAHEREPRGNESPSRDAATNTKKG